MRDKILSSITPDVFQGYLADVRLDGMRKAGV